MHIKQSLIIISLFLLLTGCKNNIEKSETSHEVIPSTKIDTAKTFEEDDLLFMKFYYGMTEDEFRYYLHEELHQENLYYVNDHIATDFILLDWQIAKRNHWADLSPPELIFDKCVFKFSAEGEDFYLGLIPIFEHKKLKKIKLSYPKFTNNLVTENMEQRIKLYSEATERFYPKMVSTYESKYGRLNRNKNFIGLMMPTDLDPSLKTYPVFEYLIFDKNRVISIKNDTNISFRLEITYLKKSDYEEGIEKKRKIKDSIIIQKQLNHNSTVNSI